MIWDDPMEYRPEGGGYMTIALWEDEDVENPTYLVVDPDYEEVKKLNPEGAKAKIRYLSRRQLKPILKGLIGQYKTWDWEIIITFIQNYGGINVRLDNGAWKGFIKLVEYD